MSLTIKGASVYRVASYSAESSLLISCTSQPKSSTKKSMQFVTEKGNIDIVRLLHLAALLFLLPSTLILAAVTILEIPSPLA